MLWIGTYNGLNRYDGAHFYTYHNGTASNTLPNNTVHKLVEDKNGNIWGGTDYGVFCLDVRTGEFKNYRLPGIRKDLAIYNICTDKSGLVWAAGNNNLYFFNIATDGFTVARLQDSAAIYGIRKNGLAESPDGKGFWLATHHGMLYFDKANKDFTASKNNGDSILFNTHSSSALCKTAFGHYWYVDNQTKTIIGFDPLNKTIKYTISLSEVSGIGYGSTLFEDSNHILWLSTWNYEIFMIDYRHGNVIKRMRHQKNDVTSMAGDFFWDAMEESDGTLWFGTVAGISRCSPSRSFYKVHHLPAAVHTQENPSIGLISENPLDKTWWFITSKNILVHYNPLSGTSEQFSIYDFVADKNNRTPEYNYRILFYKDSILLFSQNGAWVKKGTSNFKPLLLQSTYANWVLRDAVLYDNHILYATTWRKLLRWDLQTGTMDSMVITEPILIEKKEPGLYRPVVNNKGNVWMTNGFDWLTCTDKNGLKLLKINYQPEEEEDDGYFTDIKMASNGVLWFAKKGDGIIYYNPATNKSKQLKQQDGLVMDHVMAVAEDSSGKIWAGAYNQFSVYNPLLNSFYNFTLPLSVNNYAYINLMATLGNGNIIASIGADVVEFFPGRLKAPQVKDKPLISMLYLNGDDTSLYYNSSLHLLPNENSLRIKFGMLTDNVAMPYDMLYIMEGAEKSWTVSSANFEANYNSLPSGDYTFKVKALAKDKSWQTKETVLQIHIATPFYKSWWFIVLVIMTVATALYSLYRFRLQKQKEVIELQSKAQLLEKEKTIVMYESLKQQLNPHFLFNSLTSLSGLIQTDQKLAVGFLEQMSKLYRYILKSSENETVPLKDEINFAKLFISLQKTRFSKGLEVNINIDEEYLHYKIAPVTLQNMVENAIKHNIIDADSPLVVDMFVEHEYVVVKNNLQKKNMVETSNKQGLESLKSLYRYLSDRPILIEEDEKSFAIKIPLI